VIVPAIGKIMYPCASTVFAVVASPFSGMYLTVLFAGKVTDAVVASNIVTPAVSGVKSIIQLMRGAFAGFEAVGATFRHTRSSTAK